MAERRPNPTRDATDGTAVRFTFDGRRLVAQCGQSVAAGLLGNGVRGLRATRGAGRPRALFCGIGNCFDCLVEVDDDLVARACLRPVIEGDEVRTSRSVGAGRPVSESSSGGIAPEEVELLVLGGGPAGMAASLHAADLGCQVVLADAGRQLGGQIHRQTSRHDAGEAEPPDVTADLPARFRRIASHGLIRRLRSATAWTVDRRPDGTFDLHLTTPGGARLLRAHALVIATGAAELPLPFPGWELPGVMTAGAAQTLVKADGVLPGERVVVAGSGPFLLPVAATLAAAGTKVVAVIEANRAFDHRRLALALGRHPAKLREAAGYLAVLARHRVPVRTGRAVVAADGQDQVERVQVARLDRDWRPQRHGRQELRVDAVCVTFGFVPALEITRGLACADVGHPERPYAVALVDDDLASTVPGVFLAGETTGVGGAEVAELEGIIAGMSAAAYLDHGPSIAGVPASVRRRLRRARRFAGQLEDVYRLRPGWLTWLRPTTIVCRCEEVAWGDVSSAVDSGAADLRAVKGTTRCGMGYCQGRICGPALQLAVAARSQRPLPQVGDFHTRHIATPVTLSTIAAAEG